MNRRHFVQALSAGAAAGSLLPLVGCERPDAPKAIAAIAADTAAAVGHDASMDNLMAAFAPDSATRELVMPARPRAIAMLAYEEMFPLDLVGPHAVLSGLMSTTVHIVGRTKRPIGASGLTIVPDTLLDECPRDLDVLFVPGGGLGTVAAMKDAAILDFLRDRASRARYVTSVCTGSLVLGAAGLLKGYRATTHWVAHGVLADFGATPVAARVVEDRNRITAAGVSAGIDFALVLAARLSGDAYARGLQLNIEYDPAPSFDAGSPAKAGPAITAALAGMYAPVVDAMREVGKA
jgi:cyclohexyl-isocyanide hydratase